MKKILCLLFSITMIFMLSISVFAKAEKEDNLLNPLQKHITNTDSDDDMIHQITSIRIDEYGKLVIEENHFAKKSNASTCAYRDRLPVSFKELRSHDGSSIERYDYRYRTFQWVNGYTSSTSYEFIKSYLVDGKEYQATVTYKFY